MNEQCQTCGRDLEVDQIGRCDSCDDGTEDSNPNVSVVVRAMESSKFGSLAEVFVVDALLRQAELVANSDPTTVQWNNPLVSFDAWQGVAKEIAAKLGAHLAPR